MEFIRTFLEQQSLLSMFLVIAVGYAIGSVNIRGFNLGIGAVLFVGLGVGMLAPKAAPPRCWASSAWSCLCMESASSTGSSSLAG